jgi:predicted nuclease with TOPRIM domain
MFSNNLVYYNMLSLVVFQIKEQYVRTVAELNNEIRTLQEEQSISANELKIAQNQSTQLRKTLEELRRQLSLQVILHLYIFKFVLCA